MDEPTKILKEAESVFKTKGVQFRTCHECNSSREKWKDEADFVITCPSCWRHFFRGFCLEDLQDG